LFSENSSDFMSRASYFDPVSENFSSFPIYSLVLLQVKAANVEKVRESGFEIIEVDREPDGHESFYILYRDK